MCAFQRISIGPTTLPPGVQQGTPDTTAVLRSQIAEAAHHLFSPANHHSDLDTVATESQQQIAELSHEIAATMLQAEATNLHGMAEVHLTVQGHEVNIQALTHTQIAVIIDHQHDNPLIFDVSFNEMLLRLNATHELKNAPSAHPTLQERRMARYLANPANNVPWPILRQTLLQMGQRAMEKEDRLFFADDILQFPYKSPQLTEKVNNLHKGDRMIIPVTINLKEIDLLCIDCHGEHKPMELTLFNSTQYSDELLQSFCEEMISGLKLTGATVENLKMLQPVFREDIGEHHDSAVQATLFLHYLLAKNDLTDRNSSINHAYAQYKHEIKQYEQETQKLKKAAMTSEEIGAARGHTAKQIRDSWLRTCLLVLPHPSR